MKPILVFGYGNLSRGDDAVGPLLLDYLEQHVELAQIELLCDFQLQIEHALDLQGRELVVFVDASVVGENAFAFKPLQACRDKSYTTHAMSPASLLQVFESVTKRTAPPSFLFSIKAESFELGEDLSPVARENLQQACQFAENLLTLSVTEIIESSDKLAATVGG